MASQRTRPSPKRTPKLTARELEALGSSARHRVRQGIERMILSGQLKPGQRLVQLDLAKHFGVAQSVIRESLIELQFGGLVRLVDNLGVFVNEMEPRRLLQAYQIREVLEGLAARLCCEEANRNDLRELQALAEQSYAAGKAGNLSQMSQLDREFHRRTIVISKNSVLLHLTEGYRAVGMILWAQRPRDLVRAEHLEIVKAIENNEPERAESLARAHVHAAWESVKIKVDAGDFSPRVVLP